MFDSTRSLCHRCWQRTERDHRPAQQAAQAPGTLHSQEYTRAPNTSVHCIYNNCANITRNRIPNAIRINVFCESKLFIPDSARVCTEHLQNNEWSNLPQMCNVTHDFNDAQFTSLCDLMRMAANNQPRIDFENRGAMPNEEMRLWTGRT